ncbi:replication protein A 70 kDa DNA-binding subunit B [Tanacetum coccineum]
MVNQSFVISNINAVKDNFSINAKGSRISDTIGNKMVSRFESLLKEGGSVNLTNFYVVKNNAPYKVANHPFKINFYKKTKVKAIQSIFSSKYGFSFVPFTKFVEDNVKEEQVVDVIGLIVAVGNVVHGERKGKKDRRIVFELTDVEGLNLKCTLWDASIDDFKTRTESSSDNIKVYVFQFGSVYKYKESVSVSNTFYSSRFFINEDIPKIDDFRSSSISGSKVDIPEFSFKVGPMLTLRSHIPLRSHEQGIQACSG